MEEQEQQKDRRFRDPMGEEAAEAALQFLRQTAAQAGKAKADVTYMESWVKVVKAKCMRKSTSRSVAGQEVDALCDDEYLAALKAQQEAIEVHETLYWKRLAAVATIDSWRSKNANHRGEGRMV
jgi:hypothetical protein